jgi:hypothetical protein
MDRAQASELLEALHAALAACYAGGSVDMVRKHLTEDVAWHVPGSNAIAGDYEGVEGVLEYGVVRARTGSRPGWWPVSALDREHVYPLRSYGGGRT